MRIVATLPLALVLACNGEDTDTDATDTDTEVIDDGPPVFEDFINVQDAPLGDLTCAPTAGTWLDQTVDAAKVGAVTTELHVIDFESDADVADANVDIWNGDDVATTPDASGITGEDGLVSLEIPTCQPYAYRTWTDPDLEVTRDTYEAHQISAPDEPVEMNSVSDTTYKIIPSILGVPIQTDKGIIAGTAYDCGLEKIENAQVIVKDAAGNIPESLIVKYFVDDFPDRDQKDTSEDGLWIAINVPEGPVTIEMYVWDGTQHVLMGATQVQSYANSINISNTYTGYGDGVRYPDACLAADAG